jgi:mRNA-degrading endonuclease RelE of RelBE toxin-antitoxin system
VGSGFWRVRAGELRVIYAIDDEAEVVVILQAARRSESTHRRVR